MTYAATASMASANGSGSRVVGAVAVGGVARQPGDRRMVQGRGRNSARRRSPRVLPRGPARRRGTAIGPLRLRASIGGRLPEELIGWHWGGFEAYRNPPFYALLYLPTAGLSYYASFLIWTAISFALLALSIILLRPARPRSCLPLGRWLLPGVRHDQLRPEHAHQSGDLRGRLPTPRIGSPFRGRAGRRAALVQAATPARPLHLVGVLSAPVSALAGLALGLTGLILAALSWGALPEGSQAFVDSLRKNVQFSGEKMWNKHTPKPSSRCSYPDLPHVHYWGLAGRVSRGVCRSLWPGESPGAPVRRLQ